MTRVTGWSTVVARDSDQALLVHSYYIGPLARTVGRAGHWRHFAATWPKLAHFAVPVHGKKTATHGLQLLRASALGRHFVSHGQGRSSHEILQLGHRQTQDTVLAIKHFWDPLRDWSWVPSKPRTAGRLPVAVRPNRPRRADRTEERFKHRRAMSGAELGTAIFPRPNEPGFLRC